MKARIICSFINYIPVIKLRSKNDRQIVIKGNLAKIY